ncbi:MAG: hypothetical protein ALMCE001_17780 [Methanocorpusculum sp. MCE]|nr:MAG: hypothetical protein ALMCE001_17780 [Methanocorpusculum sp. MCE]
MVFFHRFAHCSDILIPVFDPSIGMAEKNNEEYKNALLDMAGDIAGNPLVKPIIDQLVYDFIRSPECKKAFGEYAKRKITDKLGL